MALIEILASLTPEAGNLLYREKVSNFIVQVRQLGKLRWINFGNHPLQALVNVEDPERLIFPYMEAMIGAFLFCGKVHRLLNLGFGGGGIERYLQAVRPDIAITSVDANEEIVAIARKFFFIPKDYEVQIAAAEQFVNRCEESYSVIFCDIFDAGGQPECMTDPIFYKRISEILEQDGIAVFNNLILLEKDLLDILLPLRRFFPWVFLLEFPGLHNVLIYAMREKPPPFAELGKRAESLRNTMRSDLRWIPGRLTLLPRSSAISD